MTDPAKFTADPKNIFGVNEVIISCSALTMYVSVWYNLTWETRGIVPFL